jgi:hypothetical protein
VRGQSRRLARKWMRPMIVVLLGKFKRLLPGQVKTADHSCGPGWFSKPHEFSNCTTSYVPSALNLPHESPRAKGAREPWFARLHKQSTLA